MGRHPGEGRRGARMLAVVPSGGTMRAVLVTALVCVASGQYGNNNPVIIHNRLSGGPGHLSLGGRAAPPNPCNPNPCGPGARCSQNSQGNAICQCEPGLIPKPDTITGCGPECITDPDCGRGLVCSCPSGFTGDPLAACKRRIVVGARKKPVPVQEPRNIIVIGQQYTPDGGSREVQQQIQGRNAPRGRT